MSEKDVLHTETKKEKMRRLLTCHRFHMMIVFLVIIDCICVASELLILELERLIIPDEHACEQKPLIASNHSILNNTNHSTLNHTSHTVKHHDDHHSGVHLAFYVTESIFKYLSTSILGLFTIEVILKIILVPRVFKRKLEVLDAIIVTLTFALNLALIILHNELDALSGLFALLR